jgi:hypothetical protein
MNLNDTGNFISNALEGRQQAGAFFIGGALIIISAFILIFFLCLILKSERIKGKIKSIRIARSDKNKNEMFYPVYEYRDKQGHLLSAESNFGSNSLANMKPGKFVNLWVMPETPNIADQEGYRWLLIVILFFTLGCALISSELHSLNFGFFTWIFLTCFILYGVSQLASRMKPIDRKLMLSEWWKTKAKETIDQRLSMPTIGYSEWKARILLQDKQFQKAIPIFFLISFICIGTGYHLSGDIFKSLTDGIGTKGEVIGFQETRSSNFINFYPVVRFLDSSNRPYEFKDRTGGSPPTLKVGEKVNVIYSTKGSFHPFIDKGIWNWAIPGGMIGFGTMVFYFTAMAFRGIIKRKRL